MYRGFSCRNPDVGVGGLDTVRQRGAGGMEKGCSIIQLTFSRREGRVRKTMSRSLPWPRYLRKTASLAMDSLLAEVTLSNTFLSFRCQAVPLASVLAECPGALQRARAPAEKEAAPRQRGEKWTKQFADLAAKLGQAQQAESTLRSLLLNFLPVSCGAMTPLAGAAGLESPRSSIYEASADISRDPRGGHCSSRAPASWTGPMERTHSYSSGSLAALSQRKSSRQVPCQRGDVRC